MTSIFENTIICSLKRPVTVNSFLPLLRVLVLLLISHCHQRKVFTHSIHILCIGLFCFYLGEEFEGGIVNGAAWRPHSGSMQVNRNIATHINQMSLLIAVDLFELEKLKVSK